MARPGIVLLRKTKRTKRSDRKAKRKRDQAEAPAQAAAAELESDDAEGSYYRCTKIRKSADGDACQQSAPRRPRWTPEQTPRSHQTPDQTPRADQTAMGTTPHRHLEDRILDSLQRSTYRFGRILALTRPGLNSLFSGDHASGGLDVALGVLSSKNEVHFGVGTGGCPIVVLGPIPEVAKRESKVTCRLRQARFLGFVGSGSAIHRGKQAGDKRQSPGGKQQVESESKNSPSNVRPTSGTTGVADNELGGNNGSAGNKLMDNDGNVRQYDSTAAAAACALHGDHARRRHMARTKQLGTTSAATTIGEAEDWTAPRSDLRLPQELSQPISGTQSTEAEQHSEIICQNCQKPHCKLKGKCGKRRRNHELGHKKISWLDRIREHHMYNDREKRGVRAKIFRDVLGANGTPYDRGLPRGGIVYHRAQRCLREYLEKEGELRAVKTGRWRNGRCHPTRRVPPNFPIAGFMLNLECERRFGESRFVGCRWISLQMKNLVRWTGESGGDAFAADKHWRHRWRLEYNWSLRVPSNAKNCSIEERMPAIQAYMQRFRKMISDRSLVEDYPEQWDEVYGAFPLRFRWNWDQVPLPFVLHLGPTYAPKGARRIHNKRISEALLKRQATLQILCRGDGKQGHIAIIFRGTATKIGQWELSAYEEMDGIDVYFQVRYTISFSCPFMSI
jgi:hypothetical protein